MTRHDNIILIDTDELVKQFAEICMAQDTALLYSDVAKFNRLYSRLTEIEAELQQRSGDQRRALTSLFDHENAQVRSRQHCLRSPLRQSRHERSSRKSRVQKNIRKLAMREWQSRI